MKTKENLLKVYKNICKMSISLPIYKGIFYQRGFAYATDGRISIKSKDIYVKELEGKILSINEYSILEGKFPNFDSVYKNDNHRLIHEDFHFPEWIFELKSGNPYLYLPLFFNENLIISLDKNVDSIFCLDARIVCALKPFKHKCMSVYFKDNMSPIIFKYSDVFEIIIMSMKL